MGPLENITVVEFAGLGAAPFAAMMLSDMGAKVIRIDRVESSSFGFELFNPEFDLLNRGRRSIALDLKQMEGKEVALKLIERSDALIEGFRPGVMERLGLGPDICLHLNPKLVYGRMTGWGQDGPLSHAAGHDINYIALAGVLSGMGREGEPPPPPLNLVGDFGGGGMLLAFGIVCALMEVRTSGRGQVVDAAMIDGAALLMTSVYSLKAMNRWINKRGENFLDGGSHFYTCYECADGEYISIGAIEPQFYRLLLEKLGIEESAFEMQWDVSKWQELKEHLANIFKTKTRSEWCTLLEGTDVCIAPVLDLDEAPEHPQTRARETFINRDGVVQPAPAPRFSRTKPVPGLRSPLGGEHTTEILRELGYSDTEITELKNCGVVKESENREENK
jgi:alpha-methylacyl-CoA racemase